MVSVVPSLSRVYLSCDGAYPLQPERMHTLLVVSSPHCQQWKSLVKDVQAEEAHSRRLAPIWAAETCRGHAGEWKPAHGRYAAWRGRPQRVGCSQQWVQMHKHDSKTACTFCQLALQQCGFSSCVRAIAVSHVNRRGVLKGDWFLLKAACKMWTCSVSHV